MWQGLSIGLGSVPELKPVQLVEGAKPTTVQE